MATRKQLPAQVEELLRNADFLKFAESNYRDYMMAVIEDRAIPDFRDGMIPVARRILWSAYDMGIRFDSKPVKSARVVGDVLGRYHPHGDSSVYGAMVSVTNRNSPFPFIKGEGNWGSMTAPGFAAMRYTEARLSKNAEAVLFDKFYTPTIQYVPNYDGSFKEPLHLPGILPSIILTGKLGMAPGATTNIPVVTFKSLIAVLRNVYETGKLDPAFAYKTLRFTSVSGGVEIMPKTKEEHEARRALFTTTKGKIKLGSTYTFDEQTSTLTVTAFADHWAIPKLIEKVEHIEHVQDATDDTRKDDKYARLVIKLKRGLNGPQKKKVVDTIVNKLLTVSQSPVLNFTERYIDETGQAQARMRPMSLLRFLTEWIKYRIDLEKRACDYWIKEADKAIRKLELLMMACDNLEFLFQLLKSKLDRAGMNAKIAAKFKITPEEANVITEMKYFQLSKLEREALQNQKKQVQADKAELNKRKTNPRPYLAKQLEKLAELAA